jgi:hypothetical protein
MFLFFFQIAENVLLNLAKFITTFCVVIYALLQPLSNISILAEETVGVVTRFGC